MIMVQIKMPFQDFLSKASINTNSTTNYTKLRLYKKNAFKVFMWTTVEILKGNFK